MAPERRVDAGPCHEQDDRGEEQDDPADEEERLVPGPSGAALSYDEARQAGKESEELCPRGEDEGEDGSERCEDPHVHREGLESAR